MRTATVRLPGHPDAICDHLAEAVVDEYLRRDPATRIRCRVHGGAGAIFISGDVSSSADFDVSRVVQQKLGELGVMDPYEIFVALEVKGSDVRGNSLAFQHGPVPVVGCAFRETPEFIPETVSVARRVAKWMEEKRQSDPEWYWLGPDGEVTVVAAASAPSRIYIELEHGNEPLDTIRARMEESLRPLTSQLPLSLNTSGAREKRGLEYLSGASGREPSAYGSLVPALPVMSGLDPHTAEKAGSWLARHAARYVLKQTDAKAVWVRALYVPGDAHPALLKVHDERGKAYPIDKIRDLMDLRTVMRDWWRHNLNTEASQWGFVGGVGLPWEE